MFNELVFKNDPDKQNNAILYFYRMVSLASQPSLSTRRQNLLPQSYQKT